MTNWRLAIAKSLSMPSLCYVNFLYTASGWGFTLVVNVKRLYISNIFNTVVLQYGDHLGTFVQVGWYYFPLSCCHLSRQQADG